MARWKNRLLVLATLAGGGCASGEDGTDHPEESDDLPPAEGPVRWVGPDDPGVRIHGILEVVENEETTGTLIAAWSVQPVDHPVLSLLIDGGIEGCGVSGEFERSRALEADLSVRIDDMTMELLPYAPGFWGWSTVPVVGIEGRTVEPAGSGTSIVIAEALRVTNALPRATLDGTRVRLNWEPVGDGSRINVLVQVQDGPQVRCILDDDGSAILEGPVFEGELRSVFIGAAVGALWTLDGDAEWAIVGRVKTLAH